ncbi:MAG: ferrous iron transport protein B [Christensenellaceae bacterium]|jgi:ferrous iron transport protein B|nr:ferrous iron transport protein B [Christensenellaceae bacterium]
MDTIRGSLGELAPGQSGYVYAVDTADSRVRGRIVDMGITPGIEVTLVKAAPMGDPIEVSLRGYSLSLRRADALHITLMSGAEQEEYLRKRQAAQGEHARSARAQLSHARDTDAAGHRQAARLTAIFETRRANRPLRPLPNDDDAPVKLALVGNPNCGKTTLFNAMTGGHEYVGNWPGVTVEKKEGRVKQPNRGTVGQPALYTHGHEMTLVDLPGIYSLSPHSMEEIIARRFIVDEKPDAVINIVDGTNLERNLYLTVQLLELERPMIIALNMMDEVKKNGDQIDIQRLSLELGIPVIPISARTGMGVDLLIEQAQKLIHAIHVQMHEGFNIEPDDVYDDYTHAAHHRIGEVAEQYAAKAGLPLHWAEIKLLEGDPLLKERLHMPPEAQAKIDAIAREYASANPLGDNETMVADSRYQYVGRVCEAALRRARGQGEGSPSNKIDAVLTNKVLAIPIFIGIMLLIFSLTFSTVGAWLSNMVSVLIWDLLIPYVRAALERVDAFAWLTSLVCDGILTGVGGVLTFLPQIAILFFCLSLLEDSGYMSRIAFIMDKPMRRFGLSGKSFIPLLMGFGCTVPAAMGARTMDNEKDKRMTILLLPFMSCSAKLPVYGLIAGAFFSKGRGLIILSLYALGILMGIASGLLFKKKLFAGQDAPFVIELPPYRVPTARNTFTHVWERVRHFLQRAGTVIFAVSVLLWFLQSFDFRLALTQDAARSILGTLGGVVAPLFTPLGFGTWQAAVALLTGIAAKEAVVSSLAMFYGFSLSAQNGAIAAALSTTFTPRAAYAFLVFVLLYTPCLAAVTTMHRELNSGKWTVFAIVYQIVVAYLVSFAVYMILGLFLTH